ncbi:hypothetical protein WS58_15950 [Burkholderia pseudomultivorans]|nr:hypothetical protein WS58_15950 [Burkholderia pseudomultivorans]
MDDNVARTDITMHQPHTMQFPQCSAQVCEPTDSQVLVRDFIQIFSVEGQHADKIQQRHPFDPLHQRNESAGVPLGRNFVDSREMGMGSVGAHLPIGAQRRDAIVLMANDLGYIGAEFLVGMSIQFYHLERLASSPLPKATNDLVVGILERNDCILVPIVRGWKRGCRRLLRR